MLRNPSEDYACEHFHKLTKLRINSRRTSITLWQMKAINNQRKRKLNLNTK